MDKQTPVRTTADKKSIRFFLEGRKRIRSQRKANIFDIRAPLERPMRNIAVSRKRPAKCSIFPRQFPLPSNIESKVKEKRGIVMVDGKVCNGKNPSVLPLKTKDHRVNPPIKNTTSIM
jgi:hypothetical protein